MSNTKVLGVVIVMVIWLLIVGCSVLSSLFYEEEILLSTKERFSVDRDSVLEMINTGTNNVFQVVPLNYEDDEILSYIDWSSDDYYMIAGALHEYVSGEGLEGWQVEKILFGWECDDLKHGPYSASILFFKHNNKNERNTRFETELVMEPLFNTFLVNFEEIYPQRKELTGFLLSEIPFSAEEALTIAETNGGTDYRNSVGNECQVLVGSNQNSSSGIGEWRVFYVGSFGSNKGSFEIFVNTATGNVRD